MRLGVQEDDNVIDSTSQPVPVIDVMSYDQRALVPDVTGLDITDAVFLLESLGIKTNFNGQGLVKEQSLPAGDSIKANSVINLKLERP